MHKIGRNDDCFCGSGKKFKKCCLHKEETVLEMKRHHEGLIKFALDHFQPVLAERTTKFVAEFPVDKEHEQTFANISVCWDVFCTPLKDGKTITELYFDEKKPSLSSSAMDLSDGWNKAVPSLYTIEHYETDSLLIVKDVFTSELFTVNISTPQKPALDSVLLGTLVHNGSSYEFYIGYVEIPEKELPQLKERILAISPSEKATDIFRSHFPAVLQIALSDNLEPSSETVLGSASEGEEKLSGVMRLVLEIADASVYERAEGVWNQYIKEADPVIRKEAVFAAALDYFVTKDLHGEAATQAGTAKKYGVSAGSLSSRYRDIKETITSVTA
jgi:hypothetical protein